MSFRKYLLLIPAALALSVSAFAAPPVAPKPTSAPKMSAVPATAAPAATSAQPAQQSGDAQKTQQQNGPQPGKPIAFLGNSFFIFGDNALKLGSYDPQAKKELGSVVLNAPWNTNGVSLCGGNYISAAGDKNKPVCVNVNADGKLDAPAVSTDHLTLKEFNFADLPKTVASTDVFLCKDCYVLRPTFVSGFFGAKKGTDEKITNVAVRLVNKQWETLNGEVVHYGQ